MEKIIGRIEEKKVLQKILDSEEAALIAVYGRRRVGKTFLIKNFFENELAFELYGIHKETLSQQLENFTIALSKLAGREIEKPTNWLRAFALLEKYLSPLLKKKKRVIFFDEFPWLETPRSGFLGAFENFWNTWASREKNLIVVVCGSAAAWMIQRVINNRGGLHNRVTCRLPLLPFTVQEAEIFLQERKINLDRYQILQLYMVMGGVPQYLKEIQKGESATLAIDRICFEKNGFLNEEFKNLFHSLFDEAADHMKVIRALANKGKGLTRTEIITICKLKSGAGITKVLEELTESGFISSYIPFDRTAKDNIFRLTDEYSHFYIKFIEGTKIEGKGAWAKFSVSTSWRSWSGFTFEGICIKHALQIKRALGIENVYAEISMWRYHSKNGTTGTQIDLLIDRQDRCINVCELKFSTDPFEITKSYAGELQNKLSVFRTNTKTRKTLFLTMISTYGIKANNKYVGLVQNEIKMDALFQ